MVGARGLVGLWTEGPREMGAPMCAKCLSVCSVGILGCSDRWSVFSLSESLSSLLGESASLFIDEGDDLTREREIVRMLLSLVAHAVRYKTVVDVHNTVYVRRLWQALPCSPGMANDGAHNTVRQNVGAYNTAWALICLEGCKALF